MDVVVFIGTKWNIYSPILLLVVMVIFVFKVPDRLAECCGKEVFNVADGVSSHRDFQMGERILQELQEEAGGVISNGYGYLSIVNGDRWAASEGPMDHPLNEGWE